MKLKKLSIIGLIIGILAVVVAVGCPLLALLLYGLEGHSIAIIGGADGPTAVYITRLLITKWPGIVTVLAIPLILTSLFCLIFPNTVKKNCGIKTTGIALGLSATGGFGTVCFFMWLGSVAFGEISKHPVSHPAGIIGGVLALVLFFALIALYCIARRKNFKVVGVILDILTSIFYLPFFVLVEEVIIDWLRNIFHMFA